MGGSVTCQSIGSISYETEIGCEIVYKNSICLESQMSRNTFNFFSKHWV